MCVALYHGESQGTSMYVSFITVVEALTKSHFGKPRKPVHLSNVHCSGGEDQILFCTHDEFASLDEKKKALNESDVAGVICQSSRMSGTPTSSSSSSYTTTIASSDETSSSFLISDSNSVVVPAYLIAFALIVGVILAIIKTVV